MGSWFPLEYAWLTYLIDLSLQWANSGGWLGCLSSRRCDHLKNTILTRGRTKQLQILGNTTAVKAAAQNESDRSKDSGPCLNIFGHGKLAQILKLHNEGLKSLSRGLSYPQKSSFDINSYLKSWEHAVPESNRKCTTHPRGMDMTSHPPCTVRCQTRPVIMRATRR